MAVKHDGQKKANKNSSLPPNSMALGVAILGARASLYSRQFVIGSATTFR